MATTKFYLDTRRHIQGKPCQIRLSICLRGKTSFFTTGISVMPEQWDKITCTIVRHPQKQYLNARLAKLKSDWDIAIMQLVEIGDAKKAKSPSELKEMILLHLDPESVPQKKNSFLSRFLEFAQSRNAPRTRERYIDTLKKIQSFDKNELTFEDVDKKWLMCFEKFLEQTSPSANARAIHLRNIRAVFNDALDDDITMCYPFRKFKIRTQPTRKRSLTVEQVRLIHKFTENVTIMYDGDSAGIHAALRGLSIVLSEGMNVKIVLLPEGEDPDSFCRSHTLDEVRDYIAGGEKDFIAFKTELLLGQAAGDPLKKANLINDIADTIAVIPDAVKRSTYVEYTAAQFGIETQILFDRIAAQRRKMLDDRKAEMRRAERQERAAAEQPSPEAGGAPEAAETPSSGEWTEENRVLAGTERDLLYFLLSHGCDVMEFESDSEFFAGEDADKPTVAGFIRDALESDGTRMANSAYAAAYDAYFECYDRGLGQEEILKTLLDSPDRTVAAVAAALYTEKYVLSVSTFRKSMTTTQSWLVAQVPRTIMLYAERRLQDRYENLVRQLRSAGEEEQLAMLAEMKKIQSAQRRIRQKTGREKR